MKKLDEQIQIIERGTAEIINKDGLKAKLMACIKEKRPLKVKAGFDPTAPDIHLGHCVLLRKLRQFQDLGHEVYFLIGDFTALVGDPTGKDQMRPRLSEAEINKNSETYANQVFRILDKKKTKVVFNSHWLSKLNAAKMLELSAHCTVAQMLARADFKKRYENGREISLLEFIYPLLQGFDSVELKADVELGGSDQKFNLLMGRQLQEVYGQEPQIVLMTPLIEGTDGVKKMSKSLDNYIGINESPKDIFGKLMSISDELMMKYYECLTDEDLKQVKGLHPKEAKMNLAEKIITQYFDEKTALNERKEFDRVFAQGNLPSEMPEVDLQDDQTITLIDLCIEEKLVSSKKEFRRLMDQGAISFEGQKICEESWKPENGVLKIGKRRYLRINR